MLSITTFVHMNTFLGHKIDLFSQLTTPIECGLVLHKHKIHDKPRQLTSLHGECRHLLTLFVFFIIILGTYGKHKWFSFRACLLYRAHAPQVYRGGGGVTIQEGGCDDREVDFELYVQTGFSQLLGRVSHSSKSWHRFIFIYLFLNSAFDFVVDVDHAPWRECFRDV